MGCCLSREDDHFNSGSEALLPKGRNGNKRVDKSVNVNLAKKDGANGSYKSPSAVVAVGDATSKVLAKPQLPKKTMESVDLLGLDDKRLTPVATQIPKVPSVPKPTLTVEPEPTLSEPTAALESPPKLVVYEPGPPQLTLKEPSPPKRATKEPSSQTSASKPTEPSLFKRAKSSPPKTSPKKPSETENEELVAPAFTSVSIEAEDVAKDNNDDNGDENNNDSDGDDNGGDNGGKAMGKPKEPKPMKNTPTKKSKKKRKKGKK